MDPTPSHHCDDYGCGAPPPPLELLDRDISLTKHNNSIDRTNDLTNANDFTINLIETQ